MMMQASHYTFMYCKQFSTGHVGELQAQELREAGKEPYAYRYERTHMAAALHEQFKGLPDGESADLQVLTYFRTSSPSANPLFVDHAKCMHVGHARLC